MRLDWSSVVFRSMLLASLIIVTVVFAINEPKREAGQSANHGSNAEQSSGSAPKTFWQKTEEDPTAYFTMWLVIFTGVLSTVSIVQIGFLIRSDVTARRSADAALLAAQAASRQADAAIGVEIARLAVTEFDFALNEEAWSTSQRLERGEFSAFYTNHGRTSAFLTTATFASHIGTKLPVDPVEGPVFNLPSNYIITPGKAHTLPIRRGKLDRQQVSDILAEKRSLWIYGYIEYRDFLGNSHREPFTRRFLPHKGTSKGYLFLEATTVPEAYAKRW